MKPHHHVHGALRPHPPVPHIPSTSCPGCGPPHAVPLRRLASAVSCRRNSSELAGERDAAPATTRRTALVAPLLAAGASFLQSAVARAEERLPVNEPPANASSAATPPAAAENSPAQAPAVEKEEEEAINSRIYDATAIGEPKAVGKDKSKVWEKLINARIVYLGEAEQVPTRDDKVLELEIVKNLRRRCLESEKSISVAMEAFPSNLQEEVNQFIDKRFVLIKIMRMLLSLLCIWQN